MSNFPLAVNTDQYWDAIYEKEQGDDFSRINTGRYQFLLGQIKDKDKVLDFGCGIGEFLKWIKEKKPNTILTGIDYSPYAIKIAKKNCKENNYIVNDKLEGDNYDVIIMSHVIEHLKFPEEYIIDARKRLKDNGLLLVVLPAHDRVWIEHPKVWTLNDMRDFFKTFSGWFWTMVYRPNTGVVYKDGHPMEESIIIMRKLK